MKLDRTMLIIAIGASLFVGFVIVSVAIGAIFPSIHKLTAPLICRGDVQTETIRYSYKPGQVGWQHFIYCVDEKTGAKKEITFPAIGVTGLAASALIFVVLAYRWRNILVLPDNFGSLATDLEPKKPAARSSKKDKQASPLERLSELKKMRDENLISEAEFERKKSEIMEEL